MSPDASWAARLRRRCTCGHYAGDHAGPEGGQCLAILPPPWDGFGDPAPWAGYCPCPNFQEPPS